MIAGMKLFKVTDAVGRNYYVVAADMNCAVAHVQARLDAKEADPEWKENYGWVLSVEFVSRDVSEAP